MNRGMAYFAAVLVCLPTAFCGSVSLAATRRLACALTDTTAKPDSESRPITVIFDDESKMLKAEEVGQTHIFRNVSISSVSISGVSDDLSIGLDRSSLGLVFQSYGIGGRVTAIEFGRCQPADSTNQMP